LLLGSGGWGVGGWERWCWRGGLGSVGLNGGLPDQGFPLQMLSSSAFRVLGAAEGGWAMWTNGLLRGNGGWGWGVGAWGESCEGLDFLAMDKDSARSVLGEVACFGQLETRLVER
jgi:hypothetical protein